MNGPNLRIGWKEMRDSWGKEKRKMCGGEGGRTEVKQRDYWWGEAKRKKCGDTEVKQRDYWNAFELKLLSSLRSCVISTKKVCLAMAPNSSTPVQR